MKVNDGEKQTKVLETYQEFAEWIISKEDGKDTISF